ncbi:MAG: hypothetical protein ACTHOE_14025 [Conexibacter sp.]
MTATAAKAPWVDSIEIADQPQEADIKAFFGVPPDPEEQLDANIRRKRRAWRGKVRAQAASATAEKKVEFALKLIAELERRLKRGVVDEAFDLEALREQYTADPSTRVDALEDLWRVLEELLAGGRLDEALRVANDARVRFDGAAQAQAAFAWLASIASRGDADASERLRRDGLQAAQAALAGGIVNADIYAWTAILQLDLGDFAGAYSTLTVAQTELGALTPWLLGHRCEAHAGAGRLAEAGADARAAVERAGDDAALRSNVVAALVDGAASSLLPIANETALRSYDELIELAAWCAVGVPEAEDHVRPYRLWAVQAASRVYVGKIERRTIIAVATGFLLLPLLNRGRSKPVWKVFLEGPARHGMMGELVATSPIAEYVHRSVAHKLSWRA